MLVVLWRIPVTALVNSYYLVTILFSLNKTPGFSPHPGCSENPISNFLLVIHFTSVPYFFCAFFFFLLLWLLWSSAWLIGFSCLSCVHSLVCTAFIASVIITALFVSVSFDVNTLVFNLSYHWLPIIFWSNSCLKDVQIYPNFSIKWLMFWFYFI